ncbi:hypothetical protein D1AOALGA4SA_12819 [Olavius algarvensis Delta 1 endosymbiont]|nr:hypothetical protein D1AOALGA4SA_12819 [Olavius algarvensis Delta 1 endosymbiont]
MLLRQFSFAKYKELYMKDIKLDFRAERNLRYPFVNKSAAGEP